MHEKTLVSKIVSTLVQKYEVADTVLFALFAITMASFFTSAISPVVGLIGLAALYFLDQTVDHVRENDPKKLGVYEELEAGERERCEDCLDFHRPKVGFRVYYLFGYEVCRLEDFKAEICEDCASETTEEKAQREVKQVEKLLGRA